MACAQQDIIPMLGGICIMQKCFQQWLWTPVLSFRISELLSAAKQMRRGESDPADHLRCLHTGLSFLRC